MISSKAQKIFGYSGDLAVNTGLTTGVLTSWSKFDLQRPTISGAFGPYILSFATINTLWTASDLLNELD